MTICRYSDISTLAYISYSVTHDQSVSYDNLGTTYLYNNKCVEQWQCKCIDLHYVNTSYNTHDNNNTN